MLLARLSVTRGLLRRRAQPLQHFLQRAGIRKFAIRSYLIHQVRQQAAHHSRQLPGIHARLLRHLLQRIAVKHILQLTGGNGKILARTNPGTDNVAESALLKHVLQPSYSANLRAVDIFKIAPRAEACCACCAPLPPAMASTSSISPINAPFLKSLRTKRERRPGGRRPLCPKLSYFCLAIIMSLILL